MADLKPSQGIGSQRCSVLTASTSWCLCLW